MRLALLQGCNNLDQEHTCTTLQPEVWWVAATKGIVLLLYSSLYGSMWAKCSFSEQNPNFL